MVKCWRGVPRCGRRLSAKVMVAITKLATSRGKQTEGRSCGEIAGVCSHPPFRSLQDASTLNASRPARVPRPTPATRPSIP